VNRRDGGGCQVVILWSVDGCSGWLVACGDRGSKGTNHLEKRDSMVYQAVVYGLMMGAQGCS